MESNSALYFLIVLGSFFVGQGVYPLFKGEGFTINIPVFGTRFITGTPARINGFLGLIIGALILAVAFYSTENRTLVNIILAVVIVFLNIFLQIRKVNKYKERPSFSAR